MSDELPSQYDPHTIEPRWAETWVERGWFHADARSGKEPFCIVIPPPNVTGRLHVGHALGRTLEDTLIRRAKMRGLEALWVPGTDHAGIATQVVVERELANEGIDKRELGRDAFVERVWAWKRQYGGEIVEQIKRMGAACDWERERFTMDEGLSHAVRVAFVKWYEQGLIYRGERLVNWCPRDRTGISDSEVEHRDVEGELVTFRYPLSDGSGGVEVATTRVETMLGDTGIAVHPHDARYTELVGRTVRHPFDGRDIPIVADEHVDPEFGTGAVKVTPAHDPNDFEIARRAGLPLVNILNDDASLNDAVPEMFRGLDRYEARRAVRDELEREGLLVKVEPYIHSVGHCYRCHSEIEPWISGLQWFVAVERLKEPAREATLEGRVRFFPDRWQKPFLTWLDNLRDWNISRQLWWGHRIPAWYCPDGHITVAIEDPDRCAECSSGELRQDDDVLDTWFSSQLWPYSTLGWPGDTEDLRVFYPNAVLVTGYEILYLWVARMIMSGLSLAGNVPFPEVVIHGLVRDGQGRKFSKSLGNGIDPLEMIDRYGADALRFSLARLATGSQQDIPLAEEAIQGGRHFANKIWNAARLVFRAEGVPALPPDDALTIADRWLLSRHQECVREVDEALDAYEFATAAQALYRFFWSEFCDWGLEMAKDRLYEGSEADRQVAANVLAWVLERTLRLLHPTMPFVTEEIWQHFGLGETLAKSSWPDPQEFASHANALGREGETLFPFFEQLVSSVRRFRSEHQVPPKARLELRILERSPDVIGKVRPLEKEILRLAGLSAIEIVPTDADASGCARLLVQGEQVLIPVGDLFDLEAERKRLEGLLTQAHADRDRSATKLGNPSFVAKAPSDVVEAERLRLESHEREIETLGEQLASL